MNTIKKRILMIDPDKTLAVALAVSLGEAEYELVSVNTAADGLIKAYQVRPDLIVLAIQLPDACGIRICSSLREISGIPIILLSNIWSEAQIIEGMHRGADMVLVKPVSGRVMAARISAILRRTYTENDRPYQLERELHYRSLIFELDTRRVIFNEQSVKVSPTEFRLLLCMVKNHGRLLSYDYLLREVWGVEYIGQPEHLRLYIRYLRRKFETDPTKPQLIQTIKGIGYRFN